MANFMPTGAVGMDGVFYSVAHVPDLVRYGSQPAARNSRESALGDELLSKTARFMPPSPMRRIRRTSVI
jgi:hypothetical protein